MLSSQTDGKGTAAAFFTSTVWGLSFVAASIALETLSPVTLATVRFIIASIIFSPILIREAIKGYVPDRKDLRDMAFLGVISISIYFWLQYTGVKYTGAGVSSIIVVGMIPILTGGISSITLKEPFTRNKIIGTLLGFTGVVLITYPKLAVGTIDTRFFIGVACLFGNAICFSIYSTMSRKLLQRLKKPALQTSYVTLFGTLALLPLSLTSDWSVVKLLTGTQWVSILYLSTICSGLAYFLWNYALSRLESVKAAIWLYLEPVAAFTGELILFSVYPSALTIIGGVSIILGAFITARTKN